MNERAYTLILCLEHVGIADRSLRVHVAKTVVAHWITYKGLETALQYFNGSRAHLAFLYSYCTHKHKISRVLVANICIKREWLELLDDVAAHIEMKWFANSLWMSAARFDASNALPVLLKHSVFETELERHLLPMGCVVTHQARKCMQTLWQLGICTTQEHRRQLWDYMQKCGLATDPVIWRTYAYEESQFLKTYGGP